ncbi:phosphotransferase [Kitasatospora sp. NPDC085879]|uniref:phosphotransferase n=1 Tax=Kitasatospora sp. NPDC085879 TaxID=3154769 RepID=UPI00341ACFF7
MIPASAPREPVDVPPFVVEFARGRPVRAVWRNGLGGLTFQVGVDGERQFVKWLPAGNDGGLTAEVVRLRWAARYTPVPRVLEEGADEGGWRPSAPGRPRAGSTRRTGPPGCRRSEPSRRRSPRSPTSCRSTGRWSCHGDACAPNTLLGADGRYSGHVDLGALGTADRWADLAVATWSTRWNYGPGWEEPLLAAYGIAPDRERTAYYRLLWHLAD